MKLGNGQDDNKKEPVFIQPFCAISSRQLRARLMPPLCIVLICLDCLFALLSVFVSSSPSGLDASGCKVPFFPQLLSITPVTAQLSITPASDPHWEGPARWHTNIPPKKQGFRRQMKGWVLSAPSGEFAEILLHSCSPQGICVGTTFILVMFTQPPASMPHRELLCPFNWRQQEETAAEKPVKPRSSPARKNEHFSPHFQWKVCENVSMRVSVQNAFGHR